MKLKFSESMMSMFLIIMFGKCKSKKRPMEKTFQKGQQKNRRVIILKVAGTTKMLYFLHRQRGFSGLWVDTRDHK